MYEYKSKLIKATNQGVLKKLGDVERKIHYKDLMDIIKTGLKIYKMVEGRVSRIKISDTSLPTLQSEPEKDRGLLATSLKIDILRSKFPFLCIQSSVLGCSAEWILTTADLLKSQNLRLTYGINSWE